MTGESPHSTAPTSATGEFAAVDRIRARLPEPPPGETWIGDDTAVVAAPRGAWQLLAADAVVAGVHADLSLTSLADLGWKAVVANLSDLAAMGGRPGHAVVTVASPPGTDIDAIYEGIAEAAAAYRCPVVGGDLTASATLVVSVAVTGLCDRPVLRSGAAPGDHIWVTGPLGAAAAGLRLLRASAGAAPRLAVHRDPDGEALRRAHARPVPLLAEGAAAAAAGATAMIDVSDGFAADLAHVADASRVGFRLGAVPVAPGATVEEALGGGEDYQLVFTAPDPERVAKAFAGGLAPVRIGVCTADPAVRVLDGAPLAPTGWSHAL